MTAKIYFCGEIVADLKESVQGSGEFKLDLGGSQFHGCMGASKALKREKLNFRVGFVGPISTDMFGKRFIEKLEDMDVETTAVRRVERNTTLAIVVARPGMENDFSFYGRDTAEQMTKIEDLPTDLDPEIADKICCFGSISTVMEPARFAWLEFAGRQKNKALIYYDLNTRPKIAKDPVRYRGLVAEWAGLADIVKASDADIGWAYPDNTMDEVAAIWLKAGAKMAVITRGMNGSTLYTNTTKVEVTAHDLDASNTVGAGDNFNAGFAINLAKKGIFSVAALEKLTPSQLHEILAGANETAAFHLMGNGARPRHLPGAALAC